MKGKKIGKRILALVLALLMAIPATTWNILAEDVGTLKDVGTGLVTDSLNTNDTISLPIKIYDYEQDGMLFEYAENYYAQDDTAFLPSRNVIMDLDDNLTLDDDSILLENYGSSLTTTYYDVDDTSVSVPASFVRLQKNESTSGYYGGDWNGSYPTLGIRYMLGDGTDLDEIRYVTIVYRTDVVQGNIYMSMYRQVDTDGDGTADALGSAAQVGNYTGPMAFTQAGDTNEYGFYWNYAVFDLKTGTLAGEHWDSTTVGAGTVYIGLPLENTSQVFDVSRIAFFGSKELATQYGTYAITEGGDRGDNRSFGLLRDSRAEDGTTAFEDILYYTTTVKDINTYVSETQTDEDGNEVTVAIDSIDLSTVEGLGYTLLGTFKDNGIANIGLLESSLGANGYPVYKREVVVYLAALLEHALSVPARNEDGWRNYRYVQGPKNERYGGVDLATALRTKINSTMGTYEESAQKNLVGTWEEVSDNIASYYDAAYFLLNSIFVAGSYNEPQDDFDYLLLSAATSSDTNGKTYIFDAGFADSTDMENANSAVKYDKVNKTISNSSAASKKHFYYSESFTTTFFPFLPIVDKNNAEGATQSPYFQDDGVISSKPTMDTYVNRDFNYVLVSEGEFVYHENENLFFDFEGDDDVYLYINGELVMDIGSAHGIDGYYFDLNDYVNAAKAGTLGSETRNNKLALSEGDTYSFKFYYMERHGYGANMRINTNIKVTDPNMDTTKVAYQNGQPIEHGGVVNKEELIEYSFAVSNSGLENLYNFSFRDSDIGLTIDYANGLQVTGDNVYDLNGGTLEASDLTAILSHPDYDDIVVTFKNNKELKEFLVALTSDAAIESGGGLWKKSTLTIRGIGYELTDAQKKDSLFDNTVYTTSTNKLNTKVIHGQAHMRVYTDVALVYYEWANQQLNVSKADLVEDLSERIPGLVLNKVTSLELSTKDGAIIDTTTSDPIHMDSNGDMIVKYTTTGSKIFYVKLAYTHKTGVDSDSDGIMDSFNPTIGTDGNYIFDNAHGYEFSIDSVNGSIAGEDAVIVTSADAYKSSNPRWAVSVHLRPTGTGTNYEVVKVVSNPGASLNDWESVTVANTGIDFKDGDLIMVVHSSDSKPGLYDNWMSRVAAAALHEGEIVNYDSTNSKVTVVGVEKVVRGVINVTDVKDSVYVLDYGLSVDLLENNELFRNDIITVPGRSTVAQLLAVGTETPSYSPNNITFTPAGDTNGVVELTTDDFDGKFIFDKANQILKYKPTKFMDGTDSIYIAVVVCEADYAAEEEIELGNVDINEEVQMYKSISVLPANVVYYEDDFPGIHYNKDGEEVKNVFTHIGSSDNLNQSADQNQNYGQDDTYKDDANADMSGNSITQITIKESGEVAYFDFKGTGFELISRTNAFDSAKLTIKVKELSYVNGEAVVGEDNVKNIPVITEFDHNGDGGKEEIYQVPVIRVEDLTYGNYRVIISGVPSRDYSKLDADGKPTIIEPILYIDGLRIFSPLAETTEGTDGAENTVTPGKNENYIGSENGAIFEEIRELILSGKAAVANYDGESATISTGTITWTENRNNTTTSGTVFEGNRVSSANDYLSLGPNNEVYMDGDYEGTSAIVFYVTEDANATVHNLQVALHAVDKGLFYGTNSIGMESFILYGIKTNDGFAWMPLVTTYSATEQYYTIDYTKCPYVPDRGYQVAIMADSGMVSYTSLKYNGLVIGDMSGDEGEVPSLTYENGVLTEVNTGETQETYKFPAFLSLRGLLSNDNFYIDEDTVGDNVVIEDIEGDNAEDGVKEGILYQKRDGSDIRLIAYVDDLTAYSSVSFTLTINGKESKALECTTAYAGLYSSGTLKTTKDIYGEDGYFVTYTINDYIEAFGGQEVIITATYITVTGETITDVRTVTIQ